MYEEQYRPRLGGVMEKEAFCRDNTKRSRNRIAGTHPLSFYPRRVMRKWTALLKTNQYRREKKREKIDQRDRERRKKEQRRNESEGRGKEKERKSREEERKENREEKKSVPHYKTDWERRKCLTIFKAIQSNKICL